MTGPDLGSGNAGFDSPVPDVWACSAAGSAPARQAGGRRFESALVHVMPFKLRRQSAPVKWARFSVRSGGRARWCGIGRDATPARASSMGRRSSRNAHLALNEEITGSSPVRPTQRHQCGRGELGGHASLPNWSSGVGARRPLNVGDWASDRPPSFGLGRAGLNPASPAKPCYPNGTRAPAQTGCVEGSTPSQGTGPVGALDWERRKVLSAWQLAQTTSHFSISAISRLSEKPFRLNCEIV